MKRSLLIIATVLIVLISLPCLATDVTPDEGVGMQIGSTYHDEQHPARMARQVAWRGTDDIHFAWNKRYSNDYTKESIVTTYQAWNAQYTGILHWDAYANFGGDDTHAYTYNRRSRHPGIDVMSDGRGLVYYEKNVNLLYYTDYFLFVAPDQIPLVGIWSYTDSVPSGQTEEVLCGPYSSYSWPYISFQLYDNGSVEDTIIHILMKENCSSGYAEHNTHAPTELRYFRRLGGPHPYSPAHLWDDYMIVDSTYAPGYVIEASNDVSGFQAGKVAIAWIAHWPEITGDAESTTPIDYATVKQQSCNDVYIMTSDDGGASWGPKYNVTKNDSLGSGWTPLSDISALIDTDGRLQVIYAARKYENSNGGLPQLAENMNWPQFPMASRILHWSDEGEPVGSSLDDNYISVVKDMYLLWDNYPDVCPGGAFNSMSLTKPMISQCDDKLYVLFSQYQNPLNGVTDNCHISRYNGSYYDGAANGMLYFSISSMINGGMNWDPARALTGFTPRCDTGHTSDPFDPVDPEALSVCHNHGWPSMARFGMHPEITSDFVHAIVVNDPSWLQTESPDYFLDVLYVDDLFPGSVISSEGAWTMNPMKWFRIPCVDEEAGGQISPSLLEINEPDYNGGPGEEIIYTVTVENIGNIPLDIIIITEEIDNVDPAIDGWLYVDLNGFTNPLSEVQPNNTHDFYVIVNHNGVVDAPYVPTTLQGNVIFETLSRGILYKLGVEHLIPGSAFICGDINGDTNIDILDIVYLINYKYKEGPEPLCSPINSCADVNSDTNVDILDIVLLINYKYKGGPEPVCP